MFTSLFNDVTFMEKSFIFLKNYERVLASPAFLQSLYFTLLFTLVSVPLEIGLGLLVALLLNRDHQFKGVLRACVLIPWAIPTAISARTWELMYNYSFGLFNQLITGLGLSSEPINWTGSQVGAFFSLVFADVWKATPFVTIILLAGLVMIPKELYEQAMIDGANTWQKLWKITLRLLLPVIIVATLFRTADALRIFDIIYIITNGGPGGVTNSLSLLGFKYFVTGDFGKSSAVSVILFFLALGFALFYLKFSQFNKKVMDDE
jgi:multiple sugar transport system permease protein